jgi:hypothetical protein
LVDVRGLLRVALSLAVYQSHHELQPGDPHDAERVLTKLTALGAPRSEKPNTNKAVVHNRETEPLMTAVGHLLHLARLDVRFTPNNDRMADIGKRSKRAKSGN